MDELAEAAGVARRMLRAGRSRVHGDARRVLTVAVDDASRERTAAFQKHQPVYLLLATARPLRQAMVRRTLSKSALQIRLNA